MGFQEEDEKVQENIYREKGIKFSYSREWKEKEEEGKKGAGKRDRIFKRKGRKERKRNEFVFEERRGEERRDNSKR